MLTGEGRPAAGEAAHVSAAGVGYRFPDGVEALRDLRLEVGAGDFVSLVGPSGCGKSTFLRLVAGLLRGAEGELRVRGLEPGEARRRGTELAFVFQHPTLLPWRSVEANVRLPLEIRGRAGAAELARVAEVVRLVGLEEFRRARPHQLSGGMQMRASVARALVTRPGLLLLDEPFAALDPVNRAISIEELQSIHTQLGLTVILVTHRPDEAELLGTHVAVIVGGRLVAFGKAPDVFADPPGEQAVRALGLENLLPPGSVPGLPGPGPWYVPASTVIVRAGPAGPEAEGRIVLDGVVDRVQRSGPLSRVRVCGKGYHVTGYLDGEVPAFGARARAIVDPAVAHGFSPATPTTSEEIPPSPGRYRRLLGGA